MDAKYAQLNVIGADETGVGDYLTPLVAAAVFVPKANVARLLALGVKDSKLLSDLQINDLFDQIKPYIKSSVRVLSQEQYNALTTRNQLNAHELKTLLHVRAITAVEARVDAVDLVIIDQYASASNVQKYITHLNQHERLAPIRTKVLFIERGEQVHVAVAAASIVARAYLLQQMVLQEKKWQCTFPLGTNERVENAARIFVAKHGIAALGQVAKLSFRTTTKVLDASDKLK